MTARVETGIRLGEGGRGRLAAGGALDSALARFDWFYLGAEFCENLLPSPAWHEESAAFFLERGKKVCLLTPPLSEAGLKKLRAVFRRLAPLSRRFGAALEVTVNDFGAFELAAEAGLRARLSAGRLLYENMFFVKPGSVAALNEEAAGFFAGLGVRRFELSSAGRLPRVTGPVAGLSLTLHYPYLNLTGSRACITGVKDIPPEESVAAMNCARECLACALEVSHPAVKEKLLVKGNTVFVEYPRLRAAGPALLARRIDRLVYSPFL